MRGQLVVKPHRPTQARVLVGITAVAVLVVGFLLFEYGRHQGGYDTLTARAEQEMLQTRIKELTSENEELRQKIALLETSRGVDREAYSQVEGTLADLQRQLQEQREELDFYRTIVTPADGVSGLRIQELSLSAGTQSSSFRLHLVLVQAAQHDQVISGVVNLSVDGAQAGKPVTYELGKLVSDAEPVPMGFSFRYFQNLERELSLPDGFVPERVNVEVTPSGRQAKVIRQSFDWTTKTT
jgi:hypothetical protein